MLWLRPARIHKAAYDDQSAPGTHISPYYIPTVVGCKRPDSDVIIALCRAVHPDIVEQLCALCPDLLEDLMDGMLWHSACVERGQVVPLLDLTFGHLGLFLQGFFSASPRMKPGVRLA